MMTSKEINDPERRKMSKEDVEKEEMKHERTIWIDTRLSQEEMNFLWSAISEENKEPWNAGRGVDYEPGLLSNSSLIGDKNQWFFKSVLKKLSERMFYRDWDNYYKYHIEKEKSPPKFELERFWVNYQYQHEFNPLHNHSGLYSFVIFMKIPTHWEEQHDTKNLDIFRARSASDFVFVWGSENMRQEEYLRRNFTKSELASTPRIVISSENLQLSPEDEGRILFFPAWLHHMVYPFYGIDKERITIAGNISLYEPKEPEEEDGTIKTIENKTIEDKEKILKMMEFNVRQIKDDINLIQKKSGVYDG